MEQPWGAGAVVEVLIPLVTDQAVAPSGIRDRLASRQRSRARVAPKARRAVRCGNRERVIVRPVDHENCPGECVLGPTSIGWRAEPRIAPGPGPGRWISGVDDRVGRCFLVSDKGAVGRRGAIDAALPACLPKCLVAAEEGQADTRSAGSLNVGALVAGPILVVADRHEDLVVLDQRAVPVAVKPRGIADVVAVGLEPPDHRIFRVEYPRLRLDSGGVERAIVTDLVCPRVGGWTVAAVKAGTTEIVVRLPGCVRGLKDEIRGGGVVSHDENDVARAARVRSPEEREIDSRDSVNRHAPRCRDGPVPAVDQTGRRVTQTARLSLRQGC